MLSSQQGSYCQDAPLVVEIMPDGSLEVIVPAPNQIQTYENGTAQLPESAPQTEYVPQTSSDVQHEVKQESEQESVQEIKDESIAQAAEETNKEQQEQPEEQPRTEVNSNLEPQEQTVLHEEPKTQEESETLKEPEIQEDPEISQEPEMYQEAEEEVLRDSTSTESSDNNDEGNKITEVPISNDRDNSFEAEEQAK